MIYFRFVLNKTKGEMAKQPQDKKPAKPQKEAKKSEDKQVARVKDDSDEDKPFDFGGIPQRDLKKNLGCG
jgi:hypothetical protein